MKIPMNAFSQVIEMLLRTGSWKATKYLSPTTVVNATRRRYRGKLHEASRMKYGYTSEWKKAIVTLKAGDKIVLT